MPAHFPKADMNVGAPGSEGWKATVRPDTAGHTLCANVEVGRARRAGQLCFLASAAAASPPSSKAVAQAAIDRHNAALPDCWSPFDMVPVRGIPECAQSNAQRGKATNPHLPA